MNFMKTMLLVAFILPNAAFAQDGTAVRRMFEAGQYQQVIERANGAASSAALYAAAQSHQKVGATAEARETYGQLAARPEADAWHFIGLSGQQLLDDQTDAALESAQQAAASCPNFGVHLSRRTQTPRGHRAGRFEDSASAYNQLDG